MKKLLNMNYFKSVKLSLYFTIIMSVVIIIATALSLTLAVWSVKNLLSNYDQEAHKLRYSMATMLASSLKHDLEKSDFSTSKDIIDILKNGEHLTYVYIKDDAGNTVLGSSEDRDDVRKRVETVVYTQAIGDHTIYFGIPNKNLDTFYNDLAVNVIYILFALVVLAIFVSIWVSSIISKPLERLSCAAKEITEGNFDIKIDNSMFSEINDLIYSYNEMGFQLNELYSSLELKVQERTIALEEANYKLKETQAMMVHSEKMRSLGELVAGIAHEINNPVNFIHGNIMILQNYTDDLLKLIDMYEENNINFPPDIKTKIECLRNDIDLDFLRGDIKDLIKSCIEGTERTKNIVLDLKNFSRMEEMVLTQFDIPKEIDTTLNILNNKYKNRITVIKNYAPDTPKIEAYGGQLNQVFMNILDNAQDAMADVGTLTINTYKSGQDVKIEFIDTGSGIPKENLKKVFDPFFTTKPVGKGTGLGMSISYRVINDHKGTIEVESEVGKGTKFTITLPIVHEQPQETIEDEIIRDLREENGADENGA